MKNKHPKNHKSNGIVDFFTPHTELALLSSMRKFKTLTIMVIVFVLAVIGFLFFLLRMVK
ncbi:hypothetical protein C1E24_18225 [Pseudoalteromonas phenolica]|uniref:Uncharacterized protein n=1 Tax=Pseudoalteromonas phenolica TaxID=161398 RepID=A0A5R9PZW4_9GAMM|nr:hypothetical protein C1E24_18225 [Pseudoalteromonas phenolica]